MHSQCHPLGAGSVPSVSASRAKLGYRYSMLSMAHPLGVSSQGTNETSSDPLPSRQHVLRHQSLPRPPNMRLPPSTPKPHTPPPRHWRQTTGLPHIRRREEPGGQAAQVFQRCGAQHAAAGARERRSGKDCPDHGEGGTGYRRSGHAGGGGEWADMGVWSAVVTAMLIDVFALDPER